ncbi:hypothetical protein [Brumimicrobium mesophilum]|uniref:hypothetical protein n=1 Tax=Brumimicrobium mesophilum TaxID=392717 RepID=UPI000D14348D|nr:hypothetical protein [Brumimicrobium mesophilum]
MRIIFILPLIALIILSCKKEQPFINDPTNACDCLGEVTADFETGQFYKDEFVQLDTVHMYMNYEQGLPHSLNTNLYINFRAKDQNALTYEWQVGSKISTIDSPNFGLYFSDTVGVIDVRLIVNSEPRTECFPNDDGIDTIVKSLCIKSLMSPPLVGEYYGYLKSDPFHYFTVYIDTFTSYVNNDYITYGIKNLPEGNQFDIFASLNTLSFEGISEAYGDPGTYYRFESIKSSGILRNNNKLIVKFSAKKLKDDGSFDVVQYFDNEVFIGFKQ